MIQTAREARQDETLDLCRNQFYDIPQPARQYVVWAADHDSVTTVAVFRATQPYVSVNVDDGNVDPDVYRHASRANLYPAYINHRDGQAIIEYLWDEPEIHDTYNDG